MMPSTMQPFRTGRYLFGADEFVRKWVADHIDFVDAFPKNSAALGILDGDRIIAGAVYSELSAKYKTVCLHFASTSPRWATKEAVKTVLGIPFEQLGCDRIQTICRKKNKRNRKLLEGVGFKLEGVHKRYFGEWGDACSYGLLKRS